MKLSILDYCGSGVSFFTRLQKMSFHIFGSSVLLLQPKVHIICPYATIHNCWKKKKKKVEFRVCILRINNCRKKSSCSTAVWLMSKGTETNLALSSRLFLVSLRRGFVSSFSCHKKRTYISYDNIIVIVLVLVWLTFISLYLICTLIE